MFPFIELILVVGKVHLNLFRLTLISLGELFRRKHTGKFFHF